MFFADTLLTKTGALARVWVSSNIEKKLTKSQILQSDIEQSVNTIIDPGQAPMALRLSGQLLLGVVRIYRRKVNYLLDDCSEQHTRVRMTFKSGANIDRTDTTNPTNEALNIQEKLTDADIFAAFDVGMGDLFSQPLFADLESTPIGRGVDWTSSLVPGSSSQQSRLAPEDRPHLEDDAGVELDLGFDDPIGNDTTISVEAGRDAPAPRPIGEDLFSDERVLDADELGLDLGFGDDVPMDDVPAPNVPVDDQDMTDNAIGMPDDTAGIDLGEDEAPPAVDAPPQNQRARDSQSPLSDARSDVIRDLDRTFADPEDFEEQPIQRQPQRSKKRKLIVPDSETVIRSHIIKQQQEDRSKILKPATFLPRNPVLLTLMNMQKNGDFVRNVMNDGRAKNWAPELRGLLSIDVIRPAAEAKRKRDSGVGDLSEDDRTKTPRLELGEEEEDIVPMDEGIGLGGDSTMNQTEIELPGAQDIAQAQSPEEPRPHSHDGEDEGIGAGFDYDEAFDETTAPLVHPADSGPISLGTKHAVHLLRDRFGATAADSSPKKANVLFQDLLPEGKTTKEDATKMFFEVLVLATKDAVKVEQSEKTIGGPLRIRGKRGLWGDWAEREAGGEIEREEGVAPSSTAPAIAV
ncbi:MAG: hypothetical protein Q9227_004273 [Pyrenula ochraceoflavens]